MASYFSGLIRTLFFSELSPRGERLAVSVSHACRMFKGELKESFNAMWLLEGNREREGRLV